MALNWLKKLGPGLLFAGAAIGVSHLVQSTRAGASFGFGLVWAIVFIHLVKYPFFQIGPRYTTATGESLLNGYKKLGKPILITYFIINLATMFTIQAAVTIVTGGLAAQLFGISTNPVYWSIGITAICLLLLVLGKYKLLDNLMKLIIVILSISTIAAVCIATLNTEENFSFIQVLPKGTVEISFLIAFLGWMPAPIDVSVWQSLWTLEKQKDKKIKYNTKQAIFDFNISFVTTLILGICFLVLGALVMYNSDEVFSENATGFANQLIALYTTNLGKGTTIFIAAAAFTTMFSTTLTTLDASPRAMAKTVSLFTIKKLNNTYWFWITFLAMGTIVILVFFISEMGLLVKIATILSFLTTPFYAIINLLLISGKHTPKAYRTSKLFNIYAWFCIALLIGFCVWFISSW